MGKKTVRNKTSKKNVYFFGGGKADGKADMKNLLGGKGANLAEMAGHPNLRIPVPPGGPSGPLQPKILGNVLP